MAQQAAALVDEKGMAVSYEKDKAAGEDTVKFENIELGLYLVMVDAVKSPYYFYSFSPYLVAVPGNDYYSSGDDSWIYELTEKQAVGLKPAREPRLGDLVIRKNLTSYNASVGGAYFVYEVSVLPLGAAKPETNVYRISFDKAGKDGADHHRASGGGSGDGEGGLTRSQLSAFFCGGADDSDRGDAHR